MTPDEELEKVLAAFVRRRPKDVRLSPLEVLEIVTRDAFRCRICGRSVDAQPRRVIRLEGDQAGSGAEQMITVCDGCRHRLLMERFSHRTEGSSDDE